MDSLSILDYNVVMIKGENTCNLATYAMPKDEGSDDPQLIFSETKPSMYHGDTFTSSSSHGFEHLRLCMDEDATCMELPHDQCLDHDLSCLAHDLSCLDQHVPCLNHDLSCLDEHDICLDEHGSCLDRHEPCLDQHDPCLDENDPSPMNQDIPCLDDCEQFYLHMKPHVDDLEQVIKNSSITMSEFFDSKDYLNINHDDVENHILLCSTSSSSTSTSISTSTSTTNNVDDESLRLCLDLDLDEDFHDEEALLLAEVEKAEKSGLVLDGPSDSLAEATTLSEEMKGKSSDSEQSCSRGPMKGRKKMKVDWTPELHERFVHVVEQLGVDKAIPSRILELMGVNCLTRHNVASHLQKYRTHKKHVLTRNHEVVTTTNNLRHRCMEVTNNIVTNNRPTISTHAMAMRPIKSGDIKSQTHHRPMLPLRELHVWGHPTTMERFWPPCWPSPSPGCLVDAWGNPLLYTPPQPILRMPLAPMHTYVNRIVPIVPQKHQPAKEIVAASINEVLRNPFMPLPLGLKPPPLESVLSELQHQGISIAG